MAYILPSIFLLPTSTFFFFNNRAATQEKQAW